MIEDVPERALKENNTRVSRTSKIGRQCYCCRPISEARAGIEPAVKPLRGLAFPLGYLAGVKSYAVDYISPALDSLDLGLHSLLRWGFSVSSAALLMSSSEAPSVLFTAAASGGRFLRV